MPWKHGFLTHLPTFLSPQPSFQNNEAIYEDDVCQRVDFHS